MIPIPGPSYGSTTLTVLVKMRAAAGGSHGLSTGLGGAGAAALLEMEIGYGIPFRLMIGKGGSRTGNKGGDGGGLAGIGYGGLLDDIANFIAIVAGGGGSSRDNYNKPGGAGKITTGQDADAGNSLGGKGGTQIAGGLGGTGVASPLHDGNSGGALYGGGARGATTPSGVYGGGGFGSGSYDGGGGGSGKYGGGGAGWHSGNGATSAGGGGSSQLPSTGALTINDLPINIVSATGYDGTGGTPGMTGDTELGTSGTPVANTHGNDARLCISEDGGATWTTFDYTGADQIYVTGTL
jgi:hypothetical protein